MCLTFSPLELFFYWNYISRYSPSTQLSMSMSKLYPFLTHPLSGYQAFHHAVITVTTLTALAATTIAAPAGPYIQRTKTMNRSKSRNVLSSVVILEQHSLVVSDWNCSKFRSPIHWPWRSRRVVDGNFDEFVHHLALRCHCKFC